MNMTNPSFVGWTAIIGGAIGVIGFVSLMLFFIVGGPFGTLNDLSAVPVALLLIPLVLSLYRLHVADHPALSLLAALAGAAGFGLTAVGSALLVAGRIDFEQSLLPGVGGLGLIGLWMWLNCAMGLADHSLPRLLGWTGLLIGVPLSLLLPAVFQTGNIADLMAASAGQTASAGSISPLANLLLTAGFICYAGLPLWFIGAGRAVLAGVLGSPGARLLAQ
jgi:hypothetical protein